MQLLDSVSGKNASKSFKKWQTDYHLFVNKQLKRISIILINRGYILTIIGFLLGRAVIMSQFSPFSIAFFAAVMLIRRGQALQVMFAITLGASTNNWTESVGITFSIIFFLLLNKIYSSFSLKKSRLLSTYAALSLFFIRILQTYFKDGGIRAYDIIIHLTESLLALILVMIFIQCIPLFTLNRKPSSLKTEEVVSLVIMIASILSGTIGWTLFDISVGNVLSRYLVLIFAIACGASIGTTVGVVTGLVFSLSNLSSLYQITLLSFSGLLGGLLKEGRKVGVAIGLIVSTVLISLYADGKQNLIISIYETCFAILLFLFTPKIVYGKLAKSIPGTEEYNFEQQQYVRKVRDVTAHRVNQFSDVFHALSESFAHKTPSKNTGASHELDLLFSKITEKSCQNCFKKTQCWHTNFNKTYQQMTELLEALQQDNRDIPYNIKVDWQKFCVKFGRVSEAMLQELDGFIAQQQLKQQVDESRRLVADQLQGVSKVMEDFAKEIQKEQTNLQAQEERIFSIIETFGIDIEQIDIFNLEPKNIEIELVVAMKNSCEVGEKLIAPMLSEVLGEYIELQTKDCDIDSIGSNRLLFQSAKKFTIESGVAFAAKGGGLISGDSYSVINIGRAKYALAISDGMGNGKRAHEESSETLQLLQKILKSGIEEKVAIRSINSILALRKTDEVFSTLDLAMIDLQDGHTKFLKIGSTPSFIRRGIQVNKIQGNNLPIGIVKEVDVDVIHEQLFAGDILIMMSDGIFEGPKFVENYESWMIRKIRSIKASSPQAIADLILEEVIRSNDGKIRDDMTIIVAKIKSNTPKWSNIKPEKQAL